MLSACFPVDVWNYYSHNPISYRETLHTHTVCWIQCTWPHFTLTAFTHTFSQHGNPVVYPVVFLSRMFDFFSPHGCHNKCSKPSQQNISINCSNPNSVVLYQSLHMTHARQKNILKLDSMTNLVSCHVSK